jgi:hypothetical protein
MGTEKKQSLKKKKQSGPTAAKITNKERHLALGGVVSSMSWYSTLRDHD